MFRSFLDLALYFDMPWLVWFSIFWSNDAMERFGIIAYYCKKWACFNMCTYNEKLKVKLYNRLAFHLTLDGREQEIIKYLDSYDNLMTAYHCMLHDADCTEDRLMQFINNISQYPQLCEEFRQTSLSSAISCYKRNLTKVFKALFDKNLVDLSPANSAWILSHLYQDDTSLDVFLAAGPTFKTHVLKYCLSNLGVNDIVNVCAKLVSNPVKLEDIQLSGPTEVTIQDGKIVKPEHDDIWNFIVYENIEKDVILQLTQARIPHDLARNLALLSPVFHKDLLENIGYWSIINALYIQQQVFWNKLETFQRIQEKQAE